MGQKQSHHSEEEGSSPKLLRLARLARSQEGVIDFVKALSNYHENVCKRIELGAMDPQFILSAATKEDEPSKARLANAKELLLVCPRCPPTRLSAQALF